MIGKINDTFDSFGPFFSNPKLTENELLFNKFKEISYQLINCRSAVQNDGQKLTKKQIVEWNKMAAKVIVDLAELLMETKAFLKKTNSEGK